MWSIVQIGTRAHTLGQYLLKGIPGVVEKWEKYLCEMKKDFVMDSPETTSERRCSTIWQPLSLKHTNTFVGAPSWIPSPLTLISPPFYHCLRSMNGYCKLYHPAWSANQLHGWVDPDIVFAWLLCLIWSVKDWRAKEHRKTSWRPMISRQRTDPPLLPPLHLSHPPILFPVSIPPWMPLCVFLTLVSLPPQSSSPFHSPLKSGLVSPVKFPPTPSSSPQPPPSILACSDNDTEGRRGSQSSDPPVFPPGSRLSSTHNLKTQFLSQTWGPAQ